MVKNSEPLGQVMALRTVADGSDEGVDEGEGGDDDTYTCDNGEEIPRE